MATVNRGDTGDPHESHVGVGTPELGRDGYRVNDDIAIVCSVENEGNVCPWGFPVVIKLSHDEALQFCADLTARLAMRVNPPTRPLAKKVEVGVELTQSDIF